MGEGDDVAPGSTTGAVPGLGNRIHLEPGISGGIPWQGAGADQHVANASEPYCRQADMPSDERREIQTGPDQVGGERLPYVGAPCNHRLGQGSLVTCPSYQLLTKVIDLLRQVDEVGCRLGPAQVRVPNLAKVIYFVPEGI